MFVELRAEKIIKKKKSVSYKFHDRKWEILGKNSGVHASVRKKNGTCKNTDI